MSMMAIRDDDTSYWTKPEELERVYNGIWSRDIPVCLSVIPSAVRMYNAGDWYTLYQEVSTEKEIGENTSLVEFLRGLVREDKVEILMHGCNHLYHVSTGQLDVPATKVNLDKLRTGTKNLKLKWIPECLWRDKEDIRKCVSYGKQLLEELFGIQVKVFVPPSNRIGRQAVSEIAKLQLNLSGIIGRGIDRKIGVRYLYYYVYRWAYRLLKQTPYPFVIDLIDHKELVAHTLSRRSSLKSLINSLDFCIRNNAPFVLSTHYWELNEVEGLLDDLYTLVEFALDRGVTIVKLSRCFET